MLVSDAEHLLQLLEGCQLLEDKPEFWWPNYGSFEVVVGAILTQNTQWNKVEISLKNLREANLLDVTCLSDIDVAQLQDYIKPSGLYKTKAQYLQQFATYLASTYGDFESFCDGVDRESLLQQKGIGFESADAILCYACQRDGVMVVDAYTARLMNALGYEFEDYHELQSWFLNTRDLEVRTLARYHGMIVEYCKVNSKGKIVSIEALIDKD